jgi:2-polyprenyl-3-methyl-5-hydroxy-6-metoxy-1,4-benzoquinol methylase
MQTDPAACPLCGEISASHHLRAPDRFHWRHDEYELLSCSNCSGVWLTNPPRPDQMGIHYDDDYHKAIMAAGETSVAARWHRQRERISRYKSAGAILDIGCSSGAFLGTMKGEFWKLHGIEMEALTAARARTTTGAEVFVGDAVDAPFAAESFDVITCFDLLEHVYQPRQFLMKVREWLKPGGIVYIALPNIDSWESRILGTYWFGLELPRHLFHFSPRSLRYVMKSLGFSEISIVTPQTSYVEHSVGYIASSVVQAVGGTPVPMATSRKRSIPFRAARKAFRLSLVDPFSHMASWAGAGGSIEAIFERGSSSLQGSRGSSIGETSATVPEV